MLDTITETASEKPKQDTFKFNKSAKSFIDHLGEKKTYPLYHGGKFYLYNGSRFVEEIELAQAIRTYFKSEGLAQSNNTIGNVVPIVQNIAHRSLSQYGAMPFYTGKDTFPKAQDIIAYDNGLLDLTRYIAGERTLIEHTPHWANTICLPYSFDPSADCPKWYSFLDQVFEGDHGRIKLLQEWCGYLLTHDTRQHKMMVKTGVPRSGKGTTMRVEAALVGAENSTGFNLHSLTDKFGLRQLVGKLVAFVGEVNLAKSREKYRILETLNSIVGGDPQQIEEKYNPTSQSMTLPTRFVIACNEMPSFVDPSGALAARLLVLDYNVSFEENPDRQLGDKLLAEISGISNWALEGYARLKAQGSFSETDQMKALVNRFRRDNSDVLGFVQDCLVVQKEYNPGNLVGVEIVEGRLRIGIKALEDAYSEWCRENNKEGRLNWLGRNLRTIMPKVDYNKDKKIYSGLYLAKLWRSGSRPVLD